MSKSNDKYNPNKGFGTEISNNLTFNWIQKATENGSIIEQNIHGCYYENGVTDN